MNKFSDDGSFLDFFKQMNSEDPAKGNTALPGKSCRSTPKNSLSRAFKQLSQDIQLTKPRFVCDEDSIKAQSSSRKAPLSFEVEEETNEYDATLPDCSEEPVTAKTYEVIDKLVESIIEFGDDMERIIFEDQKDNPEFWFLHDKKSDTYRYFKKKLASGRKCTKRSAEHDSKNDPVPEPKKSRSQDVPVIDIESLDVPIIEEPTFEESGLQTDVSKWTDSEKTCESSKKRKSRWGPEPTAAVQLPTSSGVVTIEDDDFDMLIAMEELKRAEQLTKQKKMAFALAQGVKYNSDDEDVEANGGTKEHLLRKQEMERTEAKAKEVTELNEGRTFIGDFIPQDELLKFNLQVAKAKGNPIPAELSALSDTSNFADKKLKEDNIGFKMLKKAGWSEGAGLGTKAQGLTAPVDVNPNGGTMGLGMSQQLHQVSSNDDDVEIFRKRMMMAYKYRPNPLNNPRRPYY